MLGMQIECLSFSNNLLTTFDIESINYQKRVNLIHYLNKFLYKFLTLQVYTNVLCFLLFFVIFATKIKWKKNICSIYYELNTTL